MTAAAQPIGAERSERAFPNAPSEGWLPVFLLLAMLLSLAWAVDEARWAGVTAGNKSQTEFITWAVLFGAGWGLLSAKTRLSPLAAHAIGATLGAAFLILAVGGVIGQTADVSDRITALNDSLVRFHHDLFVDGVRSRETSVFLLGLGAIAWTTGQFAAFNVFRRHRAVDTVFITGLLMLVEVSATVLAQYMYLIIFSGAALLLIVRMNLLDQRAAWLRRHIADTTEVSGLYMRGAFVFVGIALFGSILLAATASSAPLARFWRSVDSDLVRLGNELNHVLGGVTGAARGPSGLFGTSQLIRGFWESSQAPVFRAKANTGEGFYWRAATYDAFDGSQWLQTERSRTAEVAAGSPLLQGTPDAVAPGPGREEVQITVTSVDMPGDQIVAPDSPLSVDRTAEIFTITPGGPLATIEAADSFAPGDSYRLVALIRKLRVPGGSGTGVTGNQLAAAGTAYPDWALRFTSIRGNSISPVVQRTANQILLSLPSDRRDPFHLAEAVQDYLYSDGGFVYKTDVRGLCGSERVVDCFLRIKAGYCEYFATTMAMMLRTQGIPARLAMGYLPGHKLSDGSYEIGRSAAHAWVEVFFPGYGWIPFDPTPGNAENAQRPTRLVAGPAVPTPGPGAAATPAPGREDNDPARRQGTIAPGPDDSAANPAGSGGAGPLAILVPLLLALGAFAVLMWGRARNAPAPEPEAAFRGVARLASRFGYGPRPTQTAYEYTAVLSDLVPRVRTDLQYVAHAKVRASYAPPATVLEPLRGLRDAYRRVRLGLLRLVLRRRRSVKISTRRLD